jgi:catechol 2,3-dioxygenase-like lactoylglutathione lyase family enzyme
MSDPFKTRPASRGYDSPVTFPGEAEMKMLTLFKVYVSDQEEARRFYVDQLGFEVAEDELLGDYRWLLVRMPDNEVSLNLETARTSEEKALVGRQAAGQPLFSLSTDNCKRDYAEMKGRGVKFEGEPKVMPYGTGVMMQDLYGNKIYLNQDPATAS